jgi:hypothetical protein
MDKEKEREIVTHPSVANRRSLRSGLVGVMWKGVLLSGMAGLAPLSSTAFADLSNPVALNVPAPELMGGQWRNTPGNARLTLAAERGKVTILHFWTFG